MTSCDDIMMICNTILPAMMSYLMTSSVFTRQAQGECSLIIKGSRTQEKFLFAHYFLTLKKCQKNIFLEMI